MLNHIKTLFAHNKKKSDIKNIPSDDTLVDIMVSLNKNFEINIQLSLDDQLKNKTISETEYSLVYAEFLNIIMSGKIKNQILDIIMNQIRNDDNKYLIDSIVNFLSVMDKSTTTNNSIPIIKPSQVFAKYKNG